MTEARLFLLTGADSFARNQAAQVLIDTYFEPEWQDFNFDRVDSDSGEPSLVLEKWLMPPFGGDARLIVVDYTQAQDTQISQLLGAFSDYFKTHDSPTQNRVVIQLKSVDKRKKETKAFLKFAEHQDFPEVKPWDIAKQIHPWIEEQVRREKKKITRPAVEILTQALGADKYALSRALEKIYVYLGPDSLIDETVVRQLVHQREADVFKLLECLARRDDYQARLQLQSLLLKEKSLHPVIAALASSLRKIYQSKYMLGQKYAVDAVAKQLSIHPYKLKNDLKLWQGFTFKELDKKLRHLLALDVQTKRSSAMKPELALELWIYAFVKPGL